MSDSLSSSPGGRKRQANAHSSQKNRNMFRIFHPSVDAVGPFTEDIRYDYNSGSLHAHLTHFMCIMSL